MCSTLNSQKSFGKKPRLVFKEKIGVSNVNRHAKKSLNKPEKQVNKNYFFPHLARTTCRTRKFENPQNKIIYNNV